jgi:hypothetical protein
MIAGGNGSSTPIDARESAAASNSMKNTVSHGGAERPVPAARASHRRRTKALGVGTNVSSAHRWRAIGEFSSNLAFSRAKPILA